MSTPTNNAPEFEYEAIARLTAENNRLREALRDVLKLLDEGKLVRNISGDNRPDWAIKQLPMIQVLSAAAKLAYPDEALAAGKGEMK